MTSEVEEKLIIAAKDTARAVASLVPLIKAIIDQNQKILENENCLIKLLGDLSEQASQHRG